MSPAEANGIIRKFPSFDFSLIGWETDGKCGVKSCGVLFLKLLSLFQSRFVIENVDDLIFCDISIFPLVKGESKKL